MITDFVWRENIIQGFIFFFYRMEGTWRKVAKDGGNLGMEMSGFSFAGGSSL